MSGQQEPIQPGPHLLALSPKDNVGVVVVDQLAAGTRATGSFLGTGAVFTVDVTMDLPFGHKVALAVLGPGDPVVKQGEPIGHAVTRIGVGEHVHTHNLKSNRR